MNSLIDHIVTLFFSALESKARNVKQSLIRLITTKKQVIDYIALVLNEVKSSTTQLNAAKNIYSKALYFYPYQQHIVLFGREFTVTTNYSNLLKVMFYKYIYENLAESEKPSIQNEIAPFCPSDVELMLQTTTAKADMTEEQLPLAIAHKTMSKQGADVKALIGSILSPIGTLLFLLPLMSWFNNDITKPFIKMAIQMKQEPKQIVVITNSVEVFFTQNALFILLGLLFIYVSYIIALPNLSGPIRVTLEKMPIISIPFKVYKLRQAEAFLRMVTILYSTGQDTNNALKNLRDHSNNYMTWRINEIIEKFKEHGRESDAFTTNLFETDLAFQLSLFMNSPDAMKNMTNIAEKVSEIATKKIRTLTFLLPIFFSGLGFMYVGLATLTVTIGATIN